MWQLASESLSAFPEVVITTVGIGGHPVSVRQRSPRYDAETGEMPVLMPASVAPAAGPANVLAHSHDEDLWNLRIVRIKGRLESRDGGWIFVSTAFTPPSPEGFKSRWLMAKAMRRSSSRYLAARGLAHPKVNWTILKRMQRQAQLNRRQGQ
ncbi:hypothetical protein [Mycobacterium montefiorense]|uniref:Uncharacterized protein n=1 Tax=Mycobacterium montefiorense TaxID=154654 RepID=A0AA37ULV4_9MYCO|nr:hypothetical protein [Mycobacterium montefiorense]GBG37446.1 hypothetical protein MmonteBS_18180 [Mycobacterium montefiorense]GKU36607.1 hypothetical protein NJB14191_39530 [Mycobacterium montefiorense]GKU42207.1 hypothetical protein NJB14192_41900 [Mycobacterium montefiorense]GKU45866.1 hypothetical protein NJB14194_24870 [Mycobacterium montefiorense]GKU53857.1 hypothetical protein NJB14195_50980 [Mycobacterium montefiorense]